VVKEEFVSLAERGEREELPYSIGEEVVSIIREQKML
jgi:hypothetical protein